MSNPVGAKKIYSHPNLITVKLFLNPKSSYQQLLIDMEDSVREAANNGFKMEPLDLQRLVVRFELASQKDAWFFNSKPLDRATEPTYSVEACITELPNGSVAAAEFMGDVQDSMRRLIINEYPSTKFDTFLNRDKFLISAMYQHA